MTLARTREWEKVFRGGQLARETLNSRSPSGRANSRTNLRRKSLEAQFERKLECVRVVGGGRLPRGPTRGARRGIADGIHTADIEAVQ
jgi:hypothetical protein